MTKSAFGRVLAWPAALLAVATFRLAGPDAVQPVSAQSVRKPQTIATRGGALPTPLPLFPADNWWNADISTAPVDANSANFITFIGGSARSVHPDFGGIDGDNPPDGIYGIPYVVVDSTQPKRTVQFEYSDESDGVDHNTDTSFPFSHPIPDEAITQAQWIEGGPPGNQNVGGDRHMLIVDKDNKYLYELFDLFYNGTQWTAGSGAFFDMKTNNRRPEGWTSADAAGLAILPGLARYDEVYGADEIKHAFRVTVQATNGHVFPASHTAGSNPSALPMGARLRLKPGKTVSSNDAGVQRIVAALKKYGLIVADNGSNMYISGTFDTRWNNGILNPGLGQLKASDFEVIQRGYIPPVPPAPTVTTTAATVITQTGATLNGTINPNGLDTNRRFQYGLTTSYGVTTSDLAIGAGTSPVGVSFAATGLSCNTLYHFRAVGQSTGGTANGGDLTFLTSACLPSVSSSAATNVSTATADVAGNVTTDGGATITERGFVFSINGTNPNPLIGGTGVTKTAVAGTMGSFATTLSSLAASTTYAWKAFATNSVGTTYTAVGMFTTSDPADPEALTAATISIGSAAQVTISNGNPQAWYRARLFANRSYQISAWSVDDQQAEDTASLTLSVFSDNAGTVQANDVVGASAALEGTPNQQGDGKPFTATLQATATGVYKFRVLRVTGGTVPRAVNVMIRETTLFSPWTSRAAGFEGFIEIHNNTNAAISVTLRAYNNAGLLQGTGTTLTLPPNATDFRTATQTGVPVNVFAGIVLTHNGAFGAVSGNITTLNGANGLSFDSPFTPRAPNVMGSPVR